VRVTPPKGNKLTKLKVFDASLAMAANDGQRGSGLDIDLMLEGTREMPAKGVGTSVIVERAEGFREHGLILILK
jgi:hypothetical protein